MLSHLHMNCQTTAQSIVWAISMDVCTYFKMAYKFNRSAYSATDNRENNSSSIVWFQSFCKSGTHMNLMDDQITVTEIHKMSLENLHNKNFIWKHKWKQDRDFDLNFRCEAVYSGFVFMVSVTVLSNNAFKWIDVVSENFNHKCLILKYKSCVF